MLHPFRASLNAPPPPLHPTSKRFASCNPAHAPRPCSPPPSVYSNVKRCVCFCRPQEAGLAALDRLSTALNEFQALIEAKDKQAVPIKQREALSYVGAIEEAMVKGFPFDVPPEYQDRPLLLVGAGMRGAVLLAGVWVWVTAQQGSRST